jgi:hypothetical protein
MQKFIWSIIKCHGMMIGVGCAWTGLILFGKRNSRNIFITHLMPLQLLSVHVLNVDAWFGKHDVRCTIDGTFLPPTSHQGGHPRST